MHAHLVFITKYRHPVFTDTHLTRIEEIMREVCGDFETELEEFNGEVDHVHLLVSFPPKVTVSKLVNSLKEVSSAAVPAKTSKTCGPRTGEVPGCGRARILPGRSEAHRFPRCASTSNGKPAPLFEWSAQARS